ncbi:MAG TPA: nucleoside triphosphate pyrophosphatase [Steroidobacteraceae bacterium]|nr:nucleoside triphosphate pyrophosphatase [Steroidobacteraceae bacterium]
MSLPAPLILASTSPYRRQLLARLGVEFSVESPGLEEARLVDEPPAERALRLAMAKAQRIAAQRGNAVVIGSDQVAAAAEEILDKPGHVHGARAQLVRLSGAVAHFYTACAVIAAEQGFSARHLDTTRVVFRTLTAPQIERYLARESPLDCAGSFKAEGLGISLLERIESHDPTALIGLPLIWLAATLRRLGYDVP